MQEYSNCQPDQGQYLANRLVAYGTDLNHLPTPLFRMLADLMSKYQHSGRLVHYPEGVSFDAEAGEYTREESGQTWRRDHCVFSISYCHDSQNAGIRYLAVEMGPLPQPPADLPGEAALVLVMSGAMKSHWYDPVRQFMRVNAGKYLLPGLPLPEGGKGEQAGDCRIAVIDTEMERPYPIQFAGILLEQKDGRWEKTAEYATYIRLPRGWCLTRDVARVTGLSDAVLEGSGIDEREALGEIQAFLGRAELICGHAVIADIDILRGAFLRQGVSLPESLARHEIIDTQVILEYIYGLKNAVKLEKAAEMAGVGLQGDTFHDARTDADVTARLFQKLDPEFRARFHALPVVNDVMMHAPQQTELLADILDKSSRRRQRHMDQALPGTGVPGAEKKPAREGQPPARKKQTAGGRRKGYRRG